MTSRVETCPTRPLVPMPAPMGLFSMRKTTVERGPRTADAAVGGRHAARTENAQGVHGCISASPAARV